MPACRQKPGGFPLKRVGAESPVAWLPADTKGGPQAPTPGGWVDNRERHFRQLNGSFSLQNSLGQPYPAASAAGSQPATHKQGGCVSCGLTNCLWLVE